MPFIGVSIERALEALPFARLPFAIRLVEQEGEAPGFATREVERYCATPGQACSYKIGHTVFIKARERVKAALGAKYDIKNFHEAGLNCGRVPLDVLDGVIDRYIKETQA